MTKKQPYKRKDKLHTANGLSMTLNEWAIHLNVVYTTLVKQVSNYGIEYAVDRALSGEKKARKPQSNAGKPRGFAPDTTSLEFEDDLELKRRITGYLKQKTPVHVIIERERRANIGNMR